MVKEIRIYFEGDDALRSGFRKFLDQLAEAARSRKCKFNLIAANGTPVQDHQDGIKANPDAWNVLLRDSEEAISKSRPDMPDSVFWMVQIMESWFLADPESLKKYYGDGFRENALPGNRQVEQIPKSDVLSKLEAATRGTRKGKYHKTGHAPDLLAKIKPALVKAAAPHCKQLFDALLEKLAEGLHAMGGFFVGIAGGVAFGTAEKGHLCR